MGLSSVCFKDEVNTNKEQVTVYFSSAGMSTDEALALANQHFRINVASGQANITTIQILPEEVSVRSTVDYHFEFDEAKACRHLKEHSYYAPDKHKAFVNSGFVTANVIDAICDIFKDLIEGGGLGLVVRKEERNESYRGFNFIVELAGYMNSGSAAGSRYVFLALKQRRLTSKLFKTYIKRRGLHCKAMHGEESENLARSAQRGILS